MEIKASYATALFALLYFGVGIFIIYFFRKRHTGRFAGQGYKFPAIIYFIGVPVIVAMGTNFFDNYDPDAYYNLIPFLNLNNMDQQFGIGVFVYGMIPTIIYIGIGMYILSLEHHKSPLTGKKREGYRLPALIYFISVPTLIVIAISMHFAMNYSTGRFENQYGSKPVGYQLYKFLVLKDIIPRSGQSLDDKEEIKVVEKKKDKTKEETKVVENKEDTKKSDDKEKITLQASLNDRSKYESILKNLSVGEILEFELEDKNINVQLAKSKSNYCSNGVQENKTETFFDLIEGKSYSKSTCTKTGIKYYTYDNQVDQIAYYENLNKSDSLYEFLNAKYGYEASYGKDNNYIVWGLNKSFDSFYNLMIQLHAQKKDGQLTYDEMEEIYIDKFISDYLNYVRFGDHNLKFTLNADQKKDKESKDILVFNKNKNILINNSSFTGLCNDQEKYNNFYKNNYEEKDCLALLRTLIKEKLPAEIIEEYKELENLLVQKINTKQDDKLITNEKYYALVIGNNNYEHFEKLDAAANDAKVIANVLQDKYGFEVELLLNGDYRTTINSIFNMTDKLKENDNLLIYYAGHGELDTKEKRGYWLPVDAVPRKKSTAEWITNSIIADRIKATKAKHVLLMVDSCFSGTLTKMRSGGDLNIEKIIDEKYIERLKVKKTRLVITSGGNEPVVDSEDGQHSLFALKLIDTLKNNDNVINSHILFENIRRYVIANAKQTPAIGIIFEAGHDDGDFLFFAKN